MKFLIAFVLLFSIVACNDNTDVTNTNNASNTTTTASTLQSLQDAVKKYPDSLQLIEKLAASYLEVSNFDAALATLNTGIQRDSNNAAFYDFKSIVYASKGDTANAILQLQKAIDLYPSPQFIISLGALYAQTKNSQALVMADALLYASKSNSEKEAYFIKGLYYSFNNEKLKAIPYFDTCISLSYTFMDAYLEKAIALYDLQQYENAANVLLKAVTLQNGYSKGYYYLGRCYEKLNEKQDAIDAYKMAIMYNRVDGEYIEAEDALNRLGEK